jgi:hypothetical protein
MGGMAVQGQQANSSRDNPSPNISKITIAKKDGLEMFLKQ